jgi:predicted molibdopterin-dependent oxidoreductase YjgC
LVEAIERGQIRAMLIDGRITDDGESLDPAFAAALGKLEFLVVLDYSDTELAQLADIVLPKAMSLEKDGTFTSFDRTVQRVRAAVPPMGEARSVLNAIARLGERMGYGEGEPHASTIMNEIAQLVPNYGGVTYARLERAGVNVPATSYADPGTTVLAMGADGRVTLSPTLVPASA